jgi:phage shock protein C
MKKLFRIKGSGSMIGGVAAGLGEHFDIDPTLIRIVFALGFFTPAPVVITYIVLWVLLPKKERLELKAI